MKQQTFIFPFAWAEHTAIYTTRFSHSKGLIPNSEWPTQPNRRNIQRGS